jgi:hypothetical protein
MTSGLQQGHLQSTIPASVPSPYFYHQVLGGDEAGALACGLPARLSAWEGGTNDDNLIIQNFHLLLSDSTRAWLEHLPLAQIHDWEDLVRVFRGNFQGTYIRPGNSWTSKVANRSLMKASAITFDCWVDVVISNFFCLYIIMGN